MIYSITISDNDFWFMMEQCMNYLCKVYNLYNENDAKSSIEKIFTEYLNRMHVEDNIKNYILENLSVKEVKQYISHNENLEMYYFFGNTWVNQ